MKTCPKCGSVLSVVGPLYDVRLFACGTILNEDLVRESVECLQNQVQIKDNTILELREALKPFARVAEYYKSLEYKDEELVLEYCEVGLEDITFGDLRRVLEVLRGKE